MVISDIRHTRELPTKTSLPLQDKSVTDLAKTVLMGTDYRLIENPQDFRQSYKRLIMKQDFLLSYGIFDTSHISKPKLSENSLVFFARNRQNVPYKVTHDLSKKHTAYELLPYEKSHP